MANLYSTETDTEMVDTKDEVRKLVEDYIQAYPYAQNYDDFSYIRMYLQPGSKNYSDMEQFVFKTFNVTVESYYIESIDYESSNSYVVNILTIDTLNGVDAQKYTEDYYDQNELGYGNTYNGILLMIAIQDREYYITSAGEAQNAVVGDRLNSLEDSFLENLSKGKYFAAFQNYIQTCDYQLSQFVD